MTSRGFCEEEGDLPEVPGLPPLPCRFQSACAPILILRVNGVVGTLRDGPSSSSIALSSIESDPAVEMLALLPAGKNDVDCVGEVPERPSVVVDNLLPPLEVLIGVGKGPVPFVFG